MVHNIFGPSGDKEGALIVFLGMQPSILLIFYNTLTNNYLLNTYVNFTRVNIMEKMYGRFRVNVKVEPRSTFTFTRGLSHLGSILLTLVKFTYVRA